MHNLPGFLLVAWLLTGGLASRQLRAQRLLLARSNPLQAEPSPQQAAQPYRLDKVAILTNRRLPQLLTLARRSPLVRYSSAQALPAVITSFLASTNRGQPVAIANMGGDYESTDLLLDDHLPRRQLLYLGISKNFVLLAYNLGGLAASERVLLFRLQGSSIQDFWTGSIDGRQRQTTREGILHYLQVHQHEPWGLNTNIVYF